MMLIGTATATAAAIAIVHRSYWFRVVEVDGGWREGGWREVVAAGCGGERWRVTVDRQTLELGQRTKNSKGCVWPSTRVSPHHPSVWRQNSKSTVNHAMAGGGSVLYYLPTYLETLHVHQSRERPTINL